jgi:hypothetical protein
VSRPCPGARSSTVKLASSRCALEPISSAAPHRTTGPFQGCLFGRSIATVTREKCAHSDGTLRISACAQTRRSPPFTETAHLARVRGRLIYCGTHYALSRTLVVVHSIREGRRVSASCRPLLRHPRALSVAHAAGAHRRIIVAVDVHRRAAPAPRCRGAQHAAAGRRPSVSCSLSAAG